MDDQDSNTRNDNVDETEKDQTRRLLYRMLDNPGSTVVVLGTGASASSGVPVARKLLEQLMSRWGTELSRILEQHGFRVDPHDPGTWGQVPLEAILSAYAEWADDSVAPYLFLRGPGRIPHESAAWGRAPNTSYEVLAHLMSHRIVRFILSLNWDELLERSLDEELGSGAYERVESLSAFQKLALHPGRDLPDRILFKPHGTISRPATLRASWQSVRRMEAPKADALELALRQLEVESTTGEPPTVLFVGTSYGEPDIQTFFRLMATKGLVGEVYFVHPDEKFGSKTEKYAEAHLLMESGCTSSDDEGRKEWIDKHHLAMASDAFFQVVAEEMKGTSAKNDDRIATYPGAQPQLIRLGLFKRNLKPSLENRLLLELLIFAVKAKGLFTARALLECGRIGRCAADLASPKWAGSTTALGVFRGLIDHSPALLREDRDLKNPGRSVYYFEGKQGRLCDRVIHFIHKEMLVEPDRNQDVVLKQLFSELLEDFDIDIRPDSTYTLFTFENPAAIEDRNAFQEKTYDIVKSVQGSDAPLLVVAETGEWLVSGQNPKIKDYLNVPIRLIISDPKTYPKTSYHRQRSRKMLKRLRHFQHIEIKTRSWEENTNRMTIGRDQAIFFRREGKSPTLSPVFVHDNADLCRINKFFVALWDEANKQNRGAG